MGFLDLGNYFLSQVKEIFTYYLFKYFLGLCLFLFSSDTPMMQILMLHWPVSGQSQGLAGPKVGSVLHCWDCSFLASSVCSLVGEAALEACAGFQVRINHSICQHRIFTMKKPYESNEYWKNL